MEVAGSHRRKVMKSPKKSDANPAPNGWCPDVAKK